MRLARLAVVLQCFALARVGHAQDTLPLSPGARVRVQVDRDWRIRTFRGMRGDTLILELEPAVRPESVSLGAVRALDVSRGNGPSLKRAIIGTASGFAGGWVLGHFFAFVHDPGCHTENCELRTDLTVAATMVVGTVVGLFVGTFGFQKESWERVYPRRGKAEGGSARLRPPPAPGSGTRVDAIRHAPE